MPDTILDVLESLYYVPVNSSPTMFLSPGTVAEHKQSQLVTLKLFNDNFETSLEGLEKDYRLGLLSNIVDTRGEALASQTERMESEVHSHQAQLPSPPQNYLLLIMNTGTLSQESPVSPQPYLTT